MADPVISIKLKMGYQNTDFTRTMIIDDVNETVLDNVETKIEAINTSLAGGTAGGLSTFFLSDDYDAATNTGTFKKINDAVIEAVTITNIPLEG